MRIDIQAATYTSTAEMIAAYKARQQRLHGRPKVVNIAADLRKARGEQEADIDPPKSGPEALLRSLCREHDISYDDFLNKTRDPAVREIRTVIIRELAERAPNIPFTRIALLARAHITTVRQILGIEVRRTLKPEEAEVRDARALELYRQGLTQEDMAERLGISVSHIKVIKQRRGWEDRPPAYKRKKAE